VFTDVAVKVPIDATMTLLLVVHLALLLMLHLTLVLMHLPMLLLSLLVLLLLMTALLLSTVTGDVVAAMLPLTLLTMLHGLQLVLLLQLALLHCCFLPLLRLYNKGLHTVTTGCSKLVLLFTIGVTLLLLWALLLPLASLLLLQEMLLALLKCRSWHCCCFRQILAAVGGVADYWRYVATAVVVGAAVTIGIGDAAVTTCDAVAVVTSVAAVTSAWLQLVLLFVIAICCWHW
jgi:hypothetical protein